MTSDGYDVTAIGGGRTVQPSPTSSESSVTAQDTQHGAIAAAPRVAGAA